jgi:hypothetical protein
VRVIFKIISGTDIQEFIEERDTATAALDRVRALIVSRLPNIRVLKDGLPCSLAELAAATVPCRFWAITGLQQSTALRSSADRASQRREIDASERGSRPNRGGFRV